MRTQRAWLLRCGAGVVAGFVALAAEACGPAGRPPYLEEAGIPPDAPRRETGPRDDGVIDEGWIVDADATAMSLDFIEVTPSNVMVIVGGTARVRVMAHYNGGAVVDVTEAAVWAPAEGGFITVDGRGGITGVMPGMAVARVSFEGFDANVGVVIIEGGTGFSLRCDPARVTLPLGTTTPQQMRLIAMMSGEEFDATSELGVEWTSSSPEVATVDSLGQVLPTMRTGTTQVSGRLGDVTSPPCQVNVVEGAPLGEFTSITVSPARATLSRGASQALRVNANGRSSGPVDVTPMASFRVEGMAATLGTGAMGNVVTGSAAGEARVTVTFGMLSATVPVTVVDATLRAVRLEPASRAVTPGETVQMSVTGVYSDGSARMLAPESVLWSSSDERGARVSPSGLVTVSGTASGSFTITATAVTGTIPIVGTASFSVGVDAAAMLQLLPREPARIRAGESARYEARLLSPDGTSRDVTADANVTFGTASASIARAASGAMNGIVLGVSPGMTMVRARMDFSGRPTLLSNEVALVVTE